MYAFLFKYIIMWMALMQAAEVTSLDSSAEALACSSV